MSANIIIEFERTKKFIRQIQEGQQYFSCREDAPETIDLTQREETEKESSDKETPKDVCEHQ